MIEKPYTEEEVQAAIAQPRRNGILRVPKWLAISFVSALLLATLSLSVLVVSVVSNRHDEQVARKNEQVVKEAERVAQIETERIAQEKEERDDCQKMFDTRVFDARDVKSDAFAGVIAALVEAYMTTGGAHPPASFDPMKILAALAERDSAIAAYDTALAARDDWEAKGQPLPCPIERAG